MFYLLFLCVGLFSVQLSVTLCPVSQVRGRLFVCDLLKVPTCTKLLKVLFLELFSHLFCFSLLFLALTYCRGSRRS
uniref:Secreted protein n=1 Tax=Anguilla anguilla TaxID=7936 RepID=A0A0E9TJU9_ANGAN